MMSRASVLPFVLFAFLAMPVLAEDGKKPDTQPSGDEVKDAIGDAMKKADEKSHTFTAKLDLEAGGAPMFNTEMKGQHKKPITKVTTEMMGQQIEVYTDGKVAVQKDPQTGEWKKTEGQNISGAVDPEQIKKMIKSASWDKKEAKVGSHTCKVANAKVNKDEVKKLFAGGGMGGNAKVKSSSLKFYIDKTNGRVYRMKLSMSLSIDMGGGGGGTDMSVTMDYRYTYSSKVSIEIPKEVKALMEGKDEPDDEDPKAHGEKPPKGHEGSGK